MLSCKEVSRLVSESLDRKLPFWKRVSVWIHLNLCRLCRGFRKDLLKLRDTARQQAHEIEAGTSDPQAGLSKESRERIQHALESRGSSFREPRK